MRSSWSQAVTGIGNYRLNDATLLGPEPGKRKDGWMIDWPWRTDDAQAGAPRWDHWLKAAAILAAMTLAVPLFAAFI